MKEQYIFVVQELFIHPFGGANFFVNMCAYESDRRARAHARRIEKKGRQARIVDVALVRQRPKRKGKL